MSNHRQRGITFNEAGYDPLWLSDHFDALEALQNLLPQDAQLHLGQAVAHAAMNAKTEGDVVAGSAVVTSAKPLGGVIASKIPAAMAHEFPPGRKPMENPPVAGEFTIALADGTRVGTVDSSRAFEMVHPGAIYLHQGRHYEVTDLDISNQVATVTDAEGDYVEENAVCYLQVLHAEYLPPLCRLFSRWSAAADSQY